MKTRFAFAPGVLLAAFALSWPLAVAAQESRPADIDWNKAQQLMARFRSGQTLAPEEQAYLDRARQVRATMQRTGAASRPATSTRPTGLVPLDQMTATDKYKDQDGGLYGAGGNHPPREHLAAALKEAAKIVPLDGDGKPAKEGKIVLISMGMSNTTQEFSRFKELADKDPAKSPVVAIVDCAQGGQAGAQWVSGQGRERVWETADRRLAAAGVTPKQVQVVWLKQAEIQPARLGDFPRHAEELKKNIEAALVLARQRFPNLRLAYLSSRIYAGYATTTLNPEPYAYESAFAVRRVIQDQLSGKAELNYDAAKGEVKSPLVLWGPYLWADGTTPRKSDGLIWKLEDLGPDGTHPSPATGREKVGRLLLDFLKTDPTAKPWFAAGGA